MSFAPAADMRYDAPQAEPIADAFPELPIVDEGDVAVARARHGDREAQIGIVAVLQREDLALAEECFE